MRSRRRGPAAGARGPARSHRTGRQRNGSASPAAARSAWPRRAAASPRPPARAPNDDFCAAPEPRALRSPGPRSATCFSVGGLLRLARRRLGLRLDEVLGLHPTREHAGRHDDLLGVLAPGVEAIEHALVANGLGILLLLALGPADEVVGRAIGEILERLDAGLAERDQHRRRDPRDLGEIVGDAELAALGVALRLLLLQILARTRLDLACGVLVEALDMSDFGQIDEGDLLDGSEPFADEQLRDDLVDIECVHENLRALGELLLPALRFLLLGHDVDV